jgi:hypothetical protein
LGCDGNTHEIDLPLCKSALSPEFAEAVELTHFPLAGRVEFEEMLVTSSREHFPCHLEEETNKKAKLLIS